MDEIKSRIDEVETELLYFIELFNNNKFTEKKYMIEEIYEILKECNEIFNIQFAKELRREIFIFNELYHFIKYKELQLNHDMQNDTTNTISYYINEIVEPFIKLIKRLIIELENYKINEIIPFAIQYVTSSLSHSISSNIEDKIIKLHIGTVLHRDLKYTLNSIISNIMLDNCNILVNSYIEYEDELYSKHNYSLEQSLIEVKYFYNNKWNSYDLIRNQELMTLYKRIYEKVHPSYNHI